MANNVLHTSSFYAITEINPNFNYEIIHSSGDIKQLKAKELELYKKFNATDFESFKEQIDSLFLEDDRDILLRFSANNLDDALHKFSLQNNELFGLNVQFVFDLSKIPNGIPLKKGALESLKENAVINVKYEASAVKALLNQYFATHQFREKNTNWTKYLDSFVDTLMKEEFLSIKVENKSNSDTGVYTEYMRHNIPNFPWGVVKKDLEIAEQMGEDSIFYKELDLAVLRIKDFIFNKLGAGKSQELEQAMEVVWKRTFSGFSAAKFFSGGTKSNFISGVQGALGEFQTAVIFEYLARKINDGQISKIIGNTYKNGEQLRTDVEIFQKIGLQVKNYNVIGENQLMRTVTTTIHPDKIAQYLDDPNSFENFIANYYFNKSFQDVSSDDFVRMIDFLGKYLGELLNLAMNDAVDDTVTFYLINGRYLVPGSAILEAADELNIRDSITVTGPKDIKDDLYYAPVKGERNPKFTKYWHHGHNGWRPTEENRIEYNNLLSRLISIRTEFDPSRLMMNYAFL